MNLGSLSILLFQILTVLVAESQARARSENASSNWHLLPDSCGLPKDQRIIGGNVPTSMDAMPWVARLGFREVKSVPCPDRIMFLCGGSLISKRYVVSAAHCLSVREDKCRQCKLALQVIRLGEFNVETNPDCNGPICNEGHEDYGVSKIVVHSRFSPDYFYNDIVLVRVDRDVSFSAFITPICLLKGKLLDKDYVGELVHIAGWGLMKVFPEKPSNIVKWASMTVENKSVCSDAYDRYQVGSGQLCLSSSTETGPCKGDEGGPAFVFEPEESRWFVVGILSFTPRACGSTTKPVLATYLPEYTPWLLENLEE